MPLAAATALIAFWVPQQLPLEFLPLNRAEPGTLYLEITCTSDRLAMVRIRYDVPHRDPATNSIRFPVEPGDRSYTYTFPLPDAPVEGFHVEMPANGATLLINRFRVTDQSGAEIQRFTRDQFTYDAKVANVRAVSEGWTIAAAAGDMAAATHLRLSSPLLPAEMNHRNFLRCVRSWSYLTGILTLLLCAGYFAFRPPFSPNWRRDTAFIVFLAASFAVVGVRGLIKNSGWAARYAVPLVPAGLQLEIELESDRPSGAQVFWDDGNGVSEKNSIRQQYEPQTGVQVLRFALPLGPIKALRFDPLEGPGIVRVRAMRVADHGNRTIAILPPHSLKAVHDVFVNAEGDTLKIEAPDGATDPILRFEADAIEELNRLQTTAGLQSRSWK